MPERCTHGSLLFKVISYLNKTIIQEETLFENTGEIKQKVIDFFLFPVYNINKHMNNCSYDKT